MVLYVGAVSPITAAASAVTGRSCEEGAGEKEEEKRGSDGGRLKLAN